MTVENNQSLKLEIELVPQTCFYSNVRKVVSDSKWDNIRKKAYREAGYRCSICGADEQLHCHEIWSYDDENHIQHLEGFQALCENCHMIKHTGFSMHTEKGKEIFDQDELIEHFCDINECSRDDFFKHKEEAFDTWSESSKQEWDQPWMDRLKEK